MNNTLKFLAAFFRYRGGKRNNFLILIADYSLDLTFQAMVDMEKWKGIERNYNISNQTEYDLPLNNYCAGFTPSKSFQITTYTLILLSSLFGSSLVVAVFYRNKTLRQPVNYFILNMAISDLILPVLILPWQIVETYHDGVWLVDGVLGSIFCKFLWVAWNVNFTVSNFSMVATAVERFHTILFATKPPLMSRKRCLQAIGATWISSVIFFGHYFYGYRVIRYDAVLKCEFQMGTYLDTIEVWKSTWIAYVFLASSSAIVLTVLFSRIILFLYRQKRNLHLSSEIIKNIAKRNRQISYMLVIIVIVFFALLVTDAVLYAVELFLFPIVKVPCLLSWFGHVPLQMVYPVFNPILYYIFSKDYRQGFRELLFCPWSCSNKYESCFHSSVSPHAESSTLNTAQPNNFVSPHAESNTLNTVQRNNFVVENIELQEYEEPRCSNQGQHRQQLSS